MLNLGVVAEIAHGLNNLCYASFVVGAEEGGAISDNKVLTLVLKQFWKFLW